MRVWNDRLHDDAMSKSVLRFSSASLALIFIAIAVSLLLTPGTPAFRIQGNLVAVGFCLLSFALVQRNYARLAAYTLVWAIWALVSLTQWRMQVLLAHTSMVYPVLLVLSGWLCGVRSTLLMAALSGVFITTIYVVLPSGFMETASTSKTTMLLTFLVLLWIVTGATLISRRSYQQQLHTLQRKTQELASSSAELQKLSRVIEETPDSVRIISMDHRFEYVNAAFLQQMGYTRDEVIGQPTSLVRSPRDINVTYNSIMSAIHKGQVWRGEIWSRKRNGEDVKEYAVITPLFSAEGEITHVATLSVDSLKHKQAEEEIFRLTHFDELTALPNRHFLLQKISRLLTRQRLPVNAGALLLFDLDGFKHINAAKGQGAGDELLQLLAARLKANWSQDESVFRLSSDEFAVLLSTPDMHSGSATTLQAIRALAHVRQSMATPITLGNGDELQISCSAGVALFPTSEKAESATDIIQRATMALDRAKEADGSGTVFFDAEIGAKAMARYQTETELRRALKQGELRLFLQSQFMSSGECVGAEVLLRWLHPERGLIPPGAFIAIAEESDLIVDLSKWVVGESCRLIAREEQAGQPMHLSVNISPRHFRQSDFVPWLRTLLAESGVDPQRLTLELTEGQLIEKVDEAIAKMNELSVMGIHLSIDDFGTGYSSLAYLKHLPINELKIDKVFVQNAPSNRDDAALIEAILVIAKGKSLRVVAEGIETAEHAALFQDKPEVVFQGYLYGRPEEASIWLQRRA